MRIIMMMTIMIILLMIPLHASSYVSHVHQYEILFHDDIYDLSAWQQGGWTNNPDDPSSLHLTTNTCKLESWIQRTETNICPYSQFYMKYEISFNHLETHLLSKLALQYKFNDDPWITLDEIYDDKIQPKILNFTVHESNIFSLSNDEFRTSPSLTYRFSFQYVNVDHDYVFDGTCEDYTDCFIQNIYLYGLETTPSPTIELISWSPWMSLESIDLIPWMLAVGILLIIVSYFTLWLLIKREKSRQLRSIQILKKFEEKSIERKNEDTIQDFNCFRVKLTNEQFKCLSLIIIIGSIFGILISWSSAGTQQDVLYLSFYVFGTVLIVLLSLKSMVYIECWICSIILLCLSILLSIFTL
eukprot:163721_1